MSGLLQFRRGETPPATLAEGEKFLLVDGGGTPIDILYGPIGGGPPASMLSGKADLDGADIVNATIENTPIGEGSPSTGNFSAINFPDKVPCSLWGGSPAGVTVSNGASASIGLASQATNIVSVHVRQTGNAINYTARTYIINGRQAQSYVITQIGATATGVTGRDFSVSIPNDTSDFTVQNNSGASAIITGRRIVL